ncbi:MAG: class 3 adenylate cyclase [Myxococcota bacterium]|jgi:class 3 adenylate cyclase
MLPSMATVTRTVVFTDLVNYTEKTARADRETLRNLIEQHEAWTREVCEPLGGRLVKNLGDAFITLFDSATDGLRACQRLAEAGLPGTDFALRASAVTGDVEEIDNDIFGEAVNLASRLSSVTPSSEVWFSESTRRCANLAEIPWEPVGVFSFKGIPEETPCFRAPTPGRCTLPGAITEALRNSQLVRVRPSGAPPRVRPSSVVLFEGFEPGSDALNDALGSLPVLDPARLWLSAYQLAPLERRRWIEAGRGLVIGTPQALSAALEEQGRAWPEDSGKATVFLDAGSEIALELVLAGMALPAVPLGGVVAGYSYDLLAEGRWTNHSSDAILRVDVSGEGVTLQVLANGISINGRSQPPGTSRPLTGNEELSTPTGTLRYYAVEGPYIGLLAGDSPIRLAVGYGEKAEMGRNPNHPGVALPDRSGQRNLRWCSGTRARRTRAAGFTLDRALVGRRQAAISVNRSGDLRIEALHERLATYLFRPPGQLVKIDTPRTARLGDLIVMGTNVVSLSAAG